MNKSVLNILLATSFFAFLLMACSTGEMEKEKELIGNSEALIGTWRNVSMTITYQDMDSVYNVPEGKWEEVLGIKPIITTYTRDSLFESKYYGLNDSLLFTSKGKWYFKGDSLFLESDGSTDAYNFSLQDQIGRFTSLLDWNGDGLKNELYDGFQKKD